MECQQIINLLDNKPNQPSKLRTKNLVETNDDSHGITPMINDDSRYSNIHCYPSYKLFRKRILDFIRPQPNSIFNFSNSLGLTYLTRLPVGLSYFREHKLRHKFRNSLNPICNCGNTIEATKQCKM